MLTRTLRPLASICRPAQARLILSRPLATTTATETTSSSPPPTSSSTTAPRAKVPYFVGKNKFDNFGVYQKVKAGGNLKTTEIKMVEGNVGSLKEDLKVALQLGNNDIAFNNTTRHLVIKVGERPTVIANGILTVGAGTLEAAGHQLSEQHGVLRRQRGHQALYHLPHTVSISVKASHDCGRLTILIATRADLPELTAFPT